MLPRKYWKIILSFLSLCDWCLHHFGTNWFVPKFLPLCYLDINNCRQDIEDIVEEGSNGNDLSQSKFCNAWLSLAENWRPQAQFGSARGHCNSQITHNLKAWLYLNPTYSILDKPRPPCHPRLIMIRKRFSLWGLNLDWLEVLVAVRLHVSSNLGYGNA